jgi:hypothetical protein
MVKTEYKYIKFDLVLQKEKTLVYDVRNIKSQIILGTISWYSHWRQYIFSPWKEVIFSEGCLKDIADFIKQLMDERKK